MYTDFVCINKLNIGVNQMGNDHEEELPVEDKPTDEYDSSTNSCNNQSDPPKDND